MSLKNRQLSPKGMCIFIAVAGVLVLGIGVFALVMPQRHKAADLTTQIADTQAQIATARVEARKKPQQTVHVANLFKLAKAMPDETDMSGIILQLQKTATQANVQFDSIAPGTPSAGTGYTIQPLSLSFEGKFFTLEDFLHRLGSLVTVRRGTLDATGRLFSVTSINFGPGSGGFPAVTANVSVDAYVYGGGTAPAAAATAAPTDTTATTTTTTDTTSSSDAQASGATP